MDLLISGLLQLAERQDRATLAALRRGLGKLPGTAGEMYPFVIPRLPPDTTTRANAGAWSWPQQCRFIVASLFAWHPEYLDQGERWQRNFGASVRRLRQTLGETADGPERRFVALLNAEAEDLPDHLRHVIGLLRANTISVDWQQLLDDLVEWNKPTRTTQTRWAKAFWRAADEPDEEASPDAMSEPVNE